MLYPQGYYLNTFGRRLAARLLDLADRILSQKLPALACAIHQQTLSIITTAYSLFSTFSHSGLQLESFIVHLASV